MSNEVRVSLTESASRPPLRRRVVVHVIVLVARWLARLAPSRIRAVLNRLRVGASPATAEQAKAARDDVVGTSLLCSGESCLPRSLATVLLCRLRGTWPTWCAGFHPDPFRGHAWVEVGGEPVDEPFAPGHYHRMVVVEPTSRS